MLIERFCREIEGFNQRPLNLGDLYFECDRRGIIADEIAMKRSHGLSFFDEDGDPCLFINSLIPEPERIVAAFHELKHLIYRDPQPVCLSTPSYWNRNKYERQAQAIGLIALIPQTLILKMEADEIQAEYGFPRKLIDDRLHLWIADRM